jgi:CRISPR-associated protein Csm1
MDVDGLGARFRDGFHDLEEYTAFSQRMAIFFDKNIRTIQQKDYYRNDLNIIYAGGDDLFAVGRWDKIVEFAAEVRQQFMQHMQGEGVTISGGIAIVHPKFPIAKAAILSGEAEEKAKTYNDGKKNAICFFDQCISWDKEYDEVLQIKNEMLYQIDTNAVSKGLLQQLMLYAQMAARGDLKYLWHATYYLTRMIKEKQNSPAKEYLQNLRDKQITRGAAHMRLIALAARWAEQELRINKH